MCVDDVQTGGEALERVQIFILVEGLKIEFLALSGRESSLVQTFCKSCEQLNITHSSVHMTWRFVIQGCPTLIMFSLCRLFLWSVQQEVQWKGLSG